MPLSRARNRERMRQSRLHKRLSALGKIKPVQPKPMYMAGVPINLSELDADGNIIPEI